MAKFRPSAESKPAEEQDLAALRFLVQGSTALEKYAKTNSMPLWAREHILRAAAELNMAVGYLKFATEREPEKK